MPQALLKNLKTALQQHDWWYMMSEDPKYYNRGRKEEMEIYDLRQACKRAGLENESTQMYKDHLSKNVHSHKK
jgi:hypothetical protein